MEAETLAGRAFHGLLDRPIVLYATIGRSSDRGGKRRLGCGISERYPARHDRRESVDLVKSLTLSALHRR